MAGEAIIRGCRFPLRLHYDVPNHMWYEPLAGGGVRLGMTMVGVALANHQIFAFTPRPVGRLAEAGRACATVESSKWVGPARIAFDGTISEINEALVDRPGAMAREPYGAGWMMVVVPVAGDALAELPTAEAVTHAYTAWMDDNDFAGCEAAP